MRLTVHADYSLRMLIHLATRRSSAATIAGIAGAYGISKAHLNKVAYGPGLAGYVGTVRGKGGGAFNERGSGRRA
ncbi:Rrf2 family transcriptional regulator [Geminicoccus harenae]|uniref:Rrf2 family transcriptional regulator n=1 Tax=Geminicoccus harenae TaxID=2498453 RepID=UPI00168A52AB|nr:Rrf2 family transcriptional regulator [Geminicoccus harenae]